MQNKQDSFSINLCADDFTNKNTLNFIKKMLHEKQIEPGRVTFEILENFSYTNTVNAMDILNSIHDLGCKIAIDDFGKDYSNFGRLLDIKVDFIKIDGTFIKNIVKDKNTYTIVKAITDFAHSIGCKVIAEYVSTQKIQEKLFKLGIEYSQGYLFSKPFNDRIRLA